MPQISRQPKNKPQARTAATKAKLLDAAQTLFAEQGFEKTQLDEVAARAGYTRGAIYAHYANKEDLFLELMEQRVHARFGAICRKMEEEPDLDKRPGLFRQWIATQIGDFSWGTLTLEFKLYAVRRPELRQKLLEMYERLFHDPGRDFIELLFGTGLTKSERKSMDRRLAVFGGAINGVVLESLFRPHLLPLNHLRALIEELFEAMIRAPSAGKTRARN
jgi:AcrR family transcriptional regulator